MPLLKTGKPAADNKRFGCADDHPVSSRTRSKTTLLEENKNKSSKTRGQTVTNDKGEKVIPYKQEKKPHNSRKDKGTQTENPQRNSKRLMLKELKKTNPQQLNSIFGKTDITWGDFIKAMYSFIMEKEPRKLKSLLSLEMFDFNYEIDDILGHVLWDEETSYIKPVSLAVNCVSLECLHVLIRSDNLWEPRNKTFVVLQKNLFECIFSMNVCNSSEFVEYLKCFKLLLDFGAGVGHRPWPLQFFDKHIHDTSEHIQFMYAAGANFKLDDEDIIGDDSSGFLMYLKRKHNPQTGNRGSYQPSILQDICRDAIRNYLMDNCWYIINMFLFSSYLADHGLLTRTAADFLVYNLSTDEKGDKKPFFQ